MVVKGEGALRNYMKFGECLNFLLSALDISANRLAKAINVDSSLVNRWINGKRIPAYGTQYIESIAEYLAKNILNSFQMQTLNDLFLKIFSSNETIDDTKEKILKVLLETQGYSMECRKKERVKANRKQSKTIEDRLISNTFKSIKSITLSNEDRIILGIDNIFSVAIDLFETATRRNGDNNTIYITYYNNANTHLDQNSIYNINNILLEALNNGWSITLLLKLNIDVQEILKLMRFAKPLLASGRFFPYFLKEYDILAVGKELIIVPQIGVLFCFSTKPNFKINSAFYLKNKIAINIFEKYYLAFLRNYAQPLVKYYSIEDFTQYGYCLTETEEKIGDRYLYRCDFSTLTLPENLYFKLLKRKGLTNDEIKKDLKSYNKRLKSFQANIKNYIYYDIYQASSIDFLIKNKQYHLYSHTGTGLIDLDDQDIIEHLQNIINLLETYKNFNIAFMPNNINLDYILKKDIFFYLVKENQSVLLEVSEPSKSISKVRLSIKEPTMVKAFVEYSKEIWRQVAPVNKNKKEVISWLKKHINILKTKK